MRVHYSRDQFLATSPFGIVVKGLDHHVILGAPFNLGQLGENRRIVGRKSQGHSHVEMVSKVIPALNPSSSALHVQVVGIDDPVRVTLFGQKPLPVLREIRVDGVARDDGVEVRGAPIVLGAKHTAESLGLLLA